MAYVSRPAKVRHGHRVGGAAVLGAVLALAGRSMAAAEEGFTSLFDGRSLAGWRANESPGSWRVADGELICHGARSHLFYVGSDPDKPEEFGNFHLRMEVLTRPGANSGVFFHTAFQPDGWPAHGYEIQVNNSQGDPVRTGSLYHVVRNFNPPAPDDRWFLLELMVRGKAIGVAVDGKVLYEFVEPDGVTGTRRLSRGLFALQAHDPASEVHYRDIRVKRLPD